MPDHRVLAYGNGLTATVRVLADREQSHGGQKVRLQRTNEGSLADEIGTVPPSLTAKPCEESLIHG